MTRHPSRTLPLPALSLAIAVAVAGCGSSNDDSPSDPQNDPSQPGTTIPPGNTTPPGGTTTRPGGTTEPDDMVEPTVDDDESVEQEPSEGPTVEEESVEQETPSELPGEESSSTEPSDVEQSPVAEPEDQDPVEPSPTSGLPADTEARLDTLFAIANGDAFESLLAFLDRLDPLNSGDRTPIRIDSVTDPERPLTIRRRVFACPDGGEFSVGGYRITGQGRFALTSVENCTIGHATVDGTFFQDPSLVGPVNPIALDTTIEDYRFVDSRTGATVTMETGRVIEEAPGENGEGVLVRVGWDARSLSVTGTQASYSASSVSVRSPREDASPSEAGLTVDVQGLSGGAYDGATIATLTPFRRADAGGRYTTGALRINGATRNGTLDADGADPDAFAFTVEEGGVTTSYTVPWSDRFDFVRIDTDADALDL